MSRGGANFGGVQVAQGKFRPLRMLGEAWRTIFSVSWADPYPAGGGPCGSVVAVEGTLGRSAREVFRHSPSGCLRHPARA